MHYVLGREQYSKRICLLPLCWGVHGISICRRASGMSTHDSNQVSIKPWFSYLQDHTPWPHPKLDSPFTECSKKVTAIYSLRVDGHLRVLGIFSKSHYPTKPGEALWHFSVFISKASLHVYIYHETTLLVLHCGLLKWANIDSEAFFVDNLLCHSFSFFDNVWRRWGQKVSDCHVW